MNDFFTVNQLAEYFKVHPKTIYRRLWAKAIPAFKIGGRGNWKIAKKDIRWMKR
jgi:excisionase family DNA binding protein